MYQLAAAQPSPAPPSVLDPSVVWIPNWAIPVGGGLILLAAALDSARRRRPTWSFLLLTSTILMWWMETIGDWAGHLIFSPDLIRYHIFDGFPRKTVHDPYFVIFGYEVWAAYAIVLLWVAHLLARRWGWSMLKAVAVLALPMGYACDIVVESLWIALGWLTYAPGFGPVLTVPNGGRYPLLWPSLLMPFFPAMIAFWAGKPPVRTLNHIERIFRLDRMTRPKPEATAEPGPVRRMTKQEEYDALLDYEVVVPRWKFELARFGAWVVTFQLGYGILFILPAIILRLATGHGSPYLEPA